MSRQDQEVSSPAVVLARQAVETYVEEGRILSTPTDLCEELMERAGVFVSLKKHGELRGCIGTYEPLRVNVAEEIIHNAIRSAMADPRFHPVQRHELPDLRYSVDVLSQPERIDRLDQLDAQRYGVIVELGSQRGLLLPDLEGVNSVEQQLAIACSKAYLRRGDPFAIYRFEVRRYR